MRLLSKIKVEIAKKLLTTPIKIPLFGPFKYFEKKMATQFEHLAPLVSVAKLNNKYFTTYSFKKNNSKKKKALVVHGWMSKSIYMVKIIDQLLQNNYDVIAVDLPGHGRSPGLSLNWSDSVDIILDLQKKYGPFDLALGHSYGGSMILNAVGIKTIVKKSGLSLKVKKVILIASPTQISTVVDIFSKNLALNKNEKSIFQKEIYLKSQIDLKNLDILHFERKAPTRIKYLCLHAENDKVVPYLDSKRLLKLRGRVVLKSQKKLGHLKILYAESVMQEISNFVRL